MSSQAVVANDGGANGASSEYDLLLPLQGRIRPRRVKLSPFTSSTSAGSVLAYLGIPFAQPPTRERRWQVPQGPLPSWTATRPSKWRSDPHQDAMAMEGMYRGRKDAKSAIPRSEDCLYLNVWMPESEDARVVNRPVLVWIYGGAFSVGNCSRPLHDGARLAHESGCIVVSLTYRVGAFGFLGSRSMAEEAAGDWPLVTLASLQSKSAEGCKKTVGAGNWGLWDLVAGLLWVQASISTFGGDHSNVTVFGESAGSIAIHYLLLSRKTPESLFHKAILESGVVGTLAPRTTQAAQACFDKLVSSLCPYHLEGDEKAQLEYLRTRISSDDIAACLRPMVGKRPRSEYTPTGPDQQRLPRAREDLGLEDFAVTDQWGPVWDGVFVDEDFLQRAFAPLPPKKELRNGRSGIVVGMCADEGTMFNFLIATTQSLTDHQKLFDPALSSDIGRLYGFDAQELALRKFHGREKVERDRQAFYTCAMYTGDAQFTAPILDYMAAHASSEAGANVNGDRVDVYGFLLAHRPSMAMLEGLTVVADMTQEWAAFHTLDIPFVFGVTGCPGMDGHVFVSEVTQYGMDPDDLDDNKMDGSTLNPAPVSEEGIGMTVEEKQLSLDMMRIWTTLARLPPHGEKSEVKLPDGSSWKPLGSKGSNHGGDGHVDDIHLLAFGEAPQAPAPLPPPCPNSRARIFQTALSHHPFAQQRPIGNAALQDRVSFWMREPISGTATPSETKGDPRPGKPRMCRALQNYYGFLSAPPHFLPWSSA